MQKIKFFFIGFGFLWITIWSTVGSIIGVRLSTLNATQANLNSDVVKTLLVSAHAHMNLMGILLIIFGSIYHHLYYKLSKKVLSTVSFLAVISPVIFGIGLVGEAFLYNFFFKVISSVGAFSFLIFTLLLAGFFLKESFTK